MAKRRVVEDEEWTSVSDLTRKIKRLLETQQALQNVSVLGEVSNLTRHGSGHVYFTLKDDDAQIAAVMFAGDYRVSNYQNFQSGDKVIAKGNLTVYAPQGRYQLVVSSLKPAGSGDLHKRFLEIKDALQAAGLFDRKRPLPLYPRAIAVVTSPTGAVVMDIIRTLARRNPAVKVYVVPSAVQGPGAADALIAGLKVAARLPEVETVVLARGGGSLEDLWPFNDPTLAQAIYNSPLPVISAVGHETDFTIADFVADVRAATPTAAAALLCRDFEEMFGEYHAINNALTQWATRACNDERQLLDDYSERMAVSASALLQTERERLTHLNRRLIDVFIAFQNIEANRLQNLENTLIQSVKTFIKQKASELDLLTMQIQELDVEATLKRGFVRVFQNNLPLKSALNVLPESELTLYFADGELKALPLSQSTENQ